MPKIIIFTDFDGTLSGREGGKTVFEPFYQSLLNGYVSGVIQDYRQAPLKDSATIQGLFETQFGPYREGFDYNQPDADLLLSREAVVFLHDMLNNEDVSVKIITRNRQDYIQALLTYQGFSTEELSKLVISDSLRKDTAVQRFLSAQPDISTVYVLDDSLTDYNQMVNAVAACRIPDSQTKKYHKTPGSFEWAVYHQDINHLLQAFSLAEHEKEEEEKNEVKELAIDLFACEKDREEVETLFSKRIRNIQDVEEFKAITPPNIRRKLPSFFKTENELPEKKSEGNESSLTLING
ncbi:hypothetical protein ACD661_01360 [Legionella lytica]|uniref:Dot/Icm T4SS effector n=1 Tax=Legionella lytica TaxID=96232 RepID=A0ABW8D4Q4_9GAMM